MPTFKLEEMDDDLPYGGDNDMYFRQWRLPSMKPILDEKLDRDFQDAVTKKEEMMRKKAESRRQHSEKFDKKFQNLVEQMKKASLEDKKENVPFLKKPTALELKSAWNDLENEFASPSSTARMVPFTGKLRPRPNPIFGEKMVGLKNLVLPPPSQPPSAKPSSSTPSFGAHETVFYPQTHDSFNLDHYNGSRPSFAFSGINGATSTPVARGTFFSGRSIAEEEDDGDDSVFEHSKYVTAMESPSGRSVKQSVELPAVEKKRVELPVDKATGGDENSEQVAIQSPRLQKATEEDKNGANKPLFQSEAIQKKPEEAPQNQNKPTTLFQSDSSQKELKKPEEARQDLNKPTALLQSEASQKELKKPEEASQNLNKPGTHFQSEAMKKPEEAAKKPEEAPQNLNEPTEKTSQKPELTSTVTTEQASENNTQKGPSRPFVLFKNYIGLKKTLLDEKSAFEKSSDPHFRALLKRTITEKVTVFTHRETSTEKRSEILDFFKSLLQKKQVAGFVVIGDAPKLQLKTDEDVHYSVYSIVDTYISLAELDEELAPTISDLISRLSTAVRRIEKVFIVLMFNKSTLLRQNPQECIDKFVEHTTAESSDEKAFEWNQERALAILFFTVFTKSAFLSKRGAKMVLSHQLLWKYVETSAAYVMEVPKAPFIILQLITTCKPLLDDDKERWNELISTIELEILPELEENSFTGDEAIVSNLRHMLGVLRV